MVGADGWSLWGFDQGEGGWQVHVALFWLIVSARGESAQVTSQVLGESRS